MYVGIKPTRNIERSTSYPLTDKANQKDERVAGLICGGGIIDTGNKRGLVQQFNYILQLGGRAYRRHFDGTYPIQGYLRLFSFSRNEISPEDPEWIEKAQSIVEPVMRNIAPDCQWFAVIQRDGKSGLVHAHVVQSALHTSTLKAVSGRETSLDIFRKQTSEAMESQGYTIDPGRRRGKAEATKRQKHKREEDGLGWMKELQDRILLSVSQTTATGDFEDVLLKNGVSVSRKTKSGWTYVLSECARREFIGMKAAYDRFDIDLSMKTLNRHFKENYQNMAAQQPERRLPDINYAVSDNDKELQIENYGSIYNAIATQYLENKLNYRKKNKMTGDNKKEDV